MLEGRTIEIVLLRAGWKPILLVGRISILDGETG
jgi:hypothetical protein